MADETVTLAYTGWTLVELEGEPVEVGPDEQVPSLVTSYELDGRRLTLLADAAPVVRLVAGVPA